MRTPLAVERRSIQNAQTVLYRVQTSAGETRDFRFPRLERRFVDTTAEVRDGTENAGPEFRGHAAVFGRLSEDLGGFREVINPGAFKRVLDSNPDVFALFNHDSNYVLGRTASNTLDLREDPHGLHYYVRAADTTYARDLRTLMQRGDISQSSFAFSMGQDSRERWEETEDGQIIRTIIEVDGLFDVSPVTVPAYPQTDAQSVRSDSSPAVPPVEEGERSTELAPDETTDEESQGPQMQVRLRELKAGAQRRLALARAK